MFVITGANGFIGSAMVWELNSHGHNNILAVDRVGLTERSELLSSLRYKDFFLADEFINFLEAYPETPIKAIFHLGACSSTTETDEEFLRKVNTEYTRKLFTLATKNKWPLFYASSAAVYGDGHLGFEDLLPSLNYKPLNPYGWSKLNFDTWAEKQILSPPRWFGLRFFNVYGPNEYHKKAMSSVVFKAVNEIKANGSLRLFKSHRADYKDGLQKRDFVYVKDVTAWLWRLYQQKDVQSGIYNMGYGKARTWLDLAQAVFTQLDLPMKIEWIEMPTQIRDQYQYFTEAKMNKLYSEGLPAPRWSLEEGVADYIRNYLNQTDPWLKS